MVQKAPALAALPAAEPAANNELPLVTELVNRGVTRSIAIELVQRFPERIEPKLDVLDWLTAKGDKRSAKNPAGWLVKSIQDDYPTPKGFVSKAERQQRAEAHQAKEREAAEERRRKQEEGARERAEKAACTVYWESLTPPEQAELQAQADAQADPESLKLETGPLKRIGQQIRRDQYIRQLLKNREAAEQ